MWLVVGLGNPGTRFVKTRHNIGFMAVGEVAERYGIALKDREMYRVGKGSIEGDSVILMEPSTFMNRSGVAVRDVMKRYSIRLRNLIVVQDDIDLETGKLKIKRKGSSGGHKGVESVIEAIGADEFIRVKVGIGREVGVSAEVYVLRKFRKGEIPVIREAITRAADAVAIIVKEGADSAMNRFH